MNGGYVGHSETYVYEQPLPHPESSNEKLWWSHGGTLKGNSEARIHFLRDILKEAPGNLKPMAFFPSWMPFATLGIEGQYYLSYFNDAQPGYAIFDLPDKVKFKIEVIDTWNMTLESLSGSYSDRCTVPLPSRPYMAIRMVKIN